MATSRLNSEEFVNLVNGLKGVILVYKSTDRDAMKKKPPNSSSVRIMNRKTRRRMKFSVCGKMW